MFTSTAKTNNQQKTICQKCHCSRVTNVMFFVLFLLIILIDLL